MGNHRAFFMHAEIFCPYLISKSSSQRVVYLGLRSSWRIFQSLLVPDAANFKTSLRMAKLILSIIDMSILPFSEGAGSNKFDWMELSGTIPLRVTPAFL